MDSQKKDRVEWVSKKWDKLNGLEAIIKTAI